MRFSLFHRSYFVSLRSVAALAVVAGFLAFVPGNEAAFARQGEQQAQKVEVFDEAARLVRDRFYDPKFGGKNWNTIVDQYRPRFIEAGDRKAKAAVINAMLGELGASHMIYATDDEPAYYQLVDIFRYGLRDDIRKYFPYGVSYPGIGIFTREVDGKTFVTGVLAGQPADRGGLKTGDEIVSVDGAPFEPVASFRGKVSTAVKFEIRREKDGPLSSLEVKPERIEPRKAFQTAMRESARVIEVNGKRIGYIRVWSYAGQDYQDILEEELSEGKLKDADALIWDLRDGWGGARPEFLDIFNARAPDLTFTERSGKTSYAGFKWRKPAAVLINRGTRSGKEVLTYGFKKYGYGEVIGTQTAGALLAGRGFLLSDGSFLMVAVNDVAVDGERLEAKGVEPTIAVPFDIPYSAGADPQLDKAVEVLSEGTKG